MTVSGAPPRDLLPRALTTVREGLGTLADVREERSWGFTVRRLAHPVMWDHNALVVTGPQPGLRAIDLADEADAVLGGLRHRKVHVLDEATGAGLRAEFERMGWTTQVLVAMAAGVPAPRPRPGTPPAREASVDDVRALRTAWFREEAWADPADDDLERVLRAERDEDRRMPPRVFASDRDGSPAAFAYLRRHAGDPSLGEIDSVYVRPAARGRGHGVAVVLAVWRAAEAEGCDAVFLWADAEGAAVRFYERLGLTPVGRRFGFLRV